MAIRVTVRGPLFSGNVRSVVQAEFASANDNSSKLLTTAASSYVRRAFGGYEKGWKREPTRFGRRFIVRDRAFNPLVHAVVHETGRQPNTQAGGVRQIMRWIVLRGADIAPVGKKDVNVLGMAIAISKKHAKEGWPNRGSFKGGYYPGRPPQPMQRAMETEAAPVEHTYENAARRIARRLS